MNNLNNSTDNFSWMDLCYDSKKITQETDLLINRSKEARALILKLDSKSPEGAKKIISILADDTFEFNSFHSLAKLLKLVSPNKEIRLLWDRTYKLLDDCMEKFNIDKELFDKLSNICHDKLHNNDIFFHGKILQCFNKYGLSSSMNSSKTKAIQKLLTEINVVEEKIIGTLQMNSYSDQPMNNSLSNLVKMRNQYARLLKLDSYTNFKSNIDIVNLKKTLKDLIANSHKTCYDELKTICTDLKCNKISIQDIMSYMNKLNNKNKIKLEEALNFIFNVISEKFNLKFVKLENAKTVWSKTVTIYDIKYKKEIYGHLYVDLIARPGKIPHLILPIILNEAVVYPHNSGILRIPVMTLVGNLGDLITYLDVINIFKEMGQIVYTIFHRSNYGSSIEPNMKSFMSYFFECIAYDITLIKQLFGNNHKHIYGSLVADRAFKLKYRCINALFDYLLHGSGIQLDDDKLLLAKYNEITKSVLNKSYDQYVMPKNIPVDIIVQLIYNGGIIYSDITNSVMAYNLYNELKDKKLFDEFINKVLCCDLGPLGISVTSFMNNILSKKYDKQTSNNNINRISLSEDDNSIRLTSTNGVRQTRNDDCDDDKYISDNTNYFTETDIKQKLTKPTV
jgi:hypothetical protein